MCLGEIVRLESVHAETATARLGERSVTVSLLTLDGPAEAGDWVVVHSGFALHRIDPLEAAQAVALRGGTGEPVHPEPRPPSDHAEPAHLQEES